MSENVVAGCEELYELTNQSCVKLDESSQHWGDIFDQFDTNKNGYLDYNEFSLLLTSTNFHHSIPRPELQQLFTEADKNGDQCLNRKEFIDIANSPHSSSYFRNAYLHFITAVIPRNSNHQLRLYKSYNRCTKFPWFILTLTTTMIALYFIDYLKYNNDQAEGPVGSFLLYTPRRRKEAWRFFTYMLVHIGGLHLGSNMVIQLILGSALERVHRWWRVGLVFMAGVLAGCLGTSVFSPGDQLVGASGGVYGLITAHLATILLNWKSMKYRYIQLFILIAFVGFEIVMYLNYNVEGTAHNAHLFGGIAGLLVGYPVLRNFHVNRCETTLRKTCAALYLISITGAVLIHVFAGHYFPQQIV